MILLSVIDLVKSYGGVKAVRGLSFDVRERSILGVLGMNGSGKTTMLDCINGLQAPTSGEIWFLGDRIDGLPVHETAARGLGRTFQVPRLFAKMTLLDNLKVPLMAAGLDDAEIAARSREWLARVGLWDLRYNHAEELSGGQQKLVELARVMVARPRLVLLDEPFAGVNPSLALLLIDVIRDLPKLHDCSVILVSHDLTSVYRLSSSILVMHEGTKLAQGDAAEIRTNPQVIETYLGA